MKKIRNSQKIYKLCSYILHFIYFHVNWLVLTGLDCKYQKNLNLWV